MILSHPCFLPRFLARVLQPELETAGHNPENPALKALEENIAAHRIVLHVCDITFAEIKRQLHEQVLSLQREAGSIEKQLRRWRKQAPRSAPKRRVEFDAEEVSGELYQCFDRFIRYTCKAEIHEALKVDPALVFARYFQRQPPFDGTDSKEFPDGFMLESLRQWAAGHGDRLYVVTRDEAMRRAVDADPQLLLLDTIHDVLAGATAELGAEAETIAEELLEHPAFDPTFTELLERQMPEATFIYTGDLPDGEAYEGKLLRVEQAGNWSVVSLTEQRVSIILDVTAEVQVEVQYDDLDGAIWDREDGRYYGAETASTEVEEEVGIEVLVEIDRASGKIIDGKVLTSEINIDGPSDYGY